MSSAGQPAAVGGPWAQLSGSTGGGPVSVGGPGGIPRPLPTVNNPNLPASIPGAPLGMTNSLTSNIYDTANSSLSTPGFNPLGVMPVSPPGPPPPPPIDPAYQRRLTKLEDENNLRRTAIVDVQRLGTQIMQGQMDVQEQVLEYQFMLEQCMEALDHQNQILNEQAEELALLRSKMKHFEYLMDALKLSSEGTQLMRSMSGESEIVDRNGLCCGDALSIRAPSTSRFSDGGPTRMTASTFQPFNPRYRSPNSRAATAATLDSRRPNPRANTNTNNRNNNSTTSNNNNKNTTYGGAATTNQGSTNRISSENVQRLSRLFDRPTTN